MTNQLTVSELIRSAAMPFEQLYERLPAVAEAETRSITLLEDSMEFGLPAADYGFLEMFCNEPGCDCRRVFFTVISSRSQDMEAVICFGWEKKEWLIRRICGWLAARGGRPVDGKGQCSNARSSYIQRLFSSRCLLSN